MIELFIKYEFMRNALIAAVLAGVTCGIIGTYVVIKRIVFLSGGIPHATFGGIGLGYLLGINPILTAIPFSVLSAFTIGAIHKKAKVNEDTAIGIVWAVGMALGIIFIGLSHTPASDLIGYLFGDIQTVQVSTLLMMLILDIIILISVFLFHREFLIVAFDEEFSTVAGVPSKSMYFLLLGLIALGVVVLIKAVGIILVIALLTIPATISRKFTSNIKKLMFISTFAGITLTVIGLWLSYLFDMASGATIVLVLGIAFVISSFLDR
ncbi:manganese transport system membrane protein MntB [archaeon BMS3Bbin15]|nr:manganese transport system membrane protein MntB [archaeon BMS3Bbin15]